MKKITLLVAVFLTANLLFAQYNKIDTSFYSEVLQETKMVDVYFPPGYDENPDTYYPVIYYLHGWGGNQNTMGNDMMAIAQTMINNGDIDPVIMVGADNSPDPFDGSMYTNSILWGNYEDYMVNDLIGWIESSFRAMPSRNYRAVMGLSMGGYGSFRYGILHKNKFRVIAAAASAAFNLTDNYLEAMRQVIVQQNQPGPPFFYDYYTSGFETKALFLYCGAFSPNYATPQNYINPPIVEYAMDENGYWIDTIADKMMNNTVAHLIHQLHPEDNVGILFGCGSADNLYQQHIAFMDSLDALGLPYEFYDHTGGHIMPYGFKQRALLFIDSLLMSPVIPCSCLPEGITFTTQEEIDNFQTNYPGCTEIEGDVTIQGNDITNLNGLSVLTSIGGIFNIGGPGWVNNPTLTSLTGLESLISIGDNFIIRYNVALTSLTGLEGLYAIGGNVLIEGNSLTSLTSLEGLTSIGGYLSIRFNGNLTSLTGLDNLTYIGGYLNIYTNNALTSLTGLEGLTYIGGLLSIGYNDALTSLTGLENLTSIGGNLNISNNALTSLTGLESLTTIGGYLEISYNNVLTSLTGLDNLTSIGGNLNISNNALTSLTGLESLTSIGGYLKIYTNNALTSLTGLESLTSIGGYLEISYNNVLTSLTGLDNLTSIGGGSLLLRWNSALTSLTGLDNIDAESITDLIIRDNNSLSTCEVQSICDYLAAPNGTVSIHSNAPGCNSPEEVIAACEATGVKETISEKGFSISPNPFTGHLTIEFNLPQTSLVSIQIFNAMGAKVAELHHGQMPAGQQQFRWDAGDLPEGLYFCRVQAGTFVTIRKIVKY